MEFELQPLRIPSGWSVEKNDFRACDPVAFDDFGDYFTEDILQLCHNSVKLTLDLGWYFNETNGTFRLYLIKDCNWEEPLEVFESRDRMEVVKKIELWSRSDYYQKHLSST